MLIHGRGNKPVLTRQTCTKLNEQFLYCQLYGLDLWLELGAFISGDCTSNDWT